MKPFFRPLSFWPLIALLVVACGGGPDETSLEGKQQKLEQLRQEYARIRSEISRLEAEINATGAVDPLAGLKKIEVMRLSPRTFNHFLEVPGDVQSRRNVMVNPELSGIILRKYAEKGDRVTAGQTIVEIDADLVRKNMQEVETRLELANALYERQANLWRQKVGSEVQYLQAKNNKESLERSLETLRTQLSKAVVRAPISGTLDDFFMNVGEMATPAAPICRIVNTEEVEVIADVSESYLSSVRKGDSVSVIFESLGLERRAVISSVGQLINPGNRTFRIEMKLANRDGMLRPNIMAIVRINDFTRPNALSAPSYLIQRATNGDKFLYKVVQEDGSMVVKRTVLKTGRSYKGETLVEEGLTAGDLLIMKGFNEVVDGEKVNVLNAATATAATTSPSDVAIANQ